ncbi:sensor histidine kinase KdpD [Parafrankia sp. EUN1f]|uniref:sensor histidine kinase n=1 Tax=Parafrankia sp. EUN1f TaxID=102897 RepID=UPI0001C451A6|nr:HAMP domain-containing sensor histidine kinase [Parafrankia sp. EUN1f]EFC83722.1 histidine kinase [Parafrankia sp. EUN1f]
MSSASPSMPARARRRHGSAHVGRAARRPEKPRPSRNHAADSGLAASGVDTTSRGPVSWFPRGRGLPTEDWAARHSLMCWVLALHLPAIVVYGLWRDHSLPHGVLAASPPALLFGAALVPGMRRVRALAASLGLLCCSVVFVHLSDGQTAMYFHFFVVVALIALYEDWTVYLLAIAFVFLASLEIGDIVTAEAAGRMEDNALVLAGLHAGFICALAGAQMVFWHYNEQSRRREEDYRQQLYEGQQSLMARLEETDRIRSDLVATVSHEFRTPLTGIRGTLLTIRRRRDRLSDAQLDGMLDSAVTYSDRLSRLLENMLTAATATGTDDNTVADLPEVVRDVIAGLTYAGNSVTVDLPPQLSVRMARQALHQVVANLVDNALVHSWPGAPVRLIAGRVGDEVVLRVRNPGPDLDPATIRQLFEPFTQRDGTATRQTDGAGMGLYVVRRLVEVHGGRLRMSSENGEIIVEVDLWAASPAAATGAAEPAPMPVPMPLPRSLRTRGDLPDPPALPAGSGALLRPRGGPSGSGAGSQVPTPTPANFPKPSSARLPAVPPAPPGPRAAAEPAQGWPSSLPADWVG